MTREQVLPLIFEKSSDALLLMTEDGVAIDCNLATVTLLKCDSKSDIIGHHASKFWPEYQTDGSRSEDSARAILKRVQSEGYMCFEWVHQCADDTFLPVEVLLTNIEFEGRHIVHVNWRDITRRREAEEALASRRALENLLTHMSSYFINLPTESVDSGIYKALGDLGNFVEADRSYIFIYQEGHMHNLYEWCAEGIAPEIDRMQNVPIDSMAWSNAQILRGVILNTPCVADLPPEAQAEKDEFAIQGVQSVLAVPMERRGQVVGFMGFDAVRQQRQWPEEVVDLLRIAAGIIANVLDRRDAERELRVANASLEQRVQERTLQLEQRQRVTASLRDTLTIINSKQALSHTLDHLVQQATMLMKADAGTLYSMDTETHQGRIEASFNIFEDDVRRLTFDLTTTAGIEMLDIIRQCKPVIAYFEKSNLEHVRQDTNVPEHIRIRRVSVLERFNGSVSVPIFVRNEPFGALLLYYTDAQTLADQDFEPAVTLGDQAALAIENARLHQSARDQHAEAEQRRHIAEGLREGLAVLNSDQSLTDILVFVVRQAMKLLATDGGALYLLDEKKKMLTVGASHGLESTYTALEIPVGGAITGRAVALGEPVSVPDLRASTELLETYLTQPNMPPGWVAALAQLQADYNAVLAVPIRTRSEIYGSITLYYSESQHFSDEVIALAVAFAGQAALVIENARLRERVRKTASVEERNRLARDLHDAVTQTLFSASMIADTLPDLWEVDQTDARQQIDRLGQLTRGALAEMRSLLIELRPTRLVQADIQTLLQQLIDAAQGRSTVTFNLKVDARCDLPDDVKIVMYRVVQEAFNNIIKHARAEHAFVSLRCNGRQAVLQILDDGCGFDLDEIKVGHFGVQIMAERAASIRATFVIDTNPGEGTEIKLLWRNDE
jgi:PAS domain S-box-containing protein